MQFVWQRSLDGYHFTGGGTFEADHFRVEEEPATIRGGCAVEPVTGNRVTYAGEMHSNLMSPPGANFHFHQRELLEALYHLVFAVRAAAGGQWRMHGC